MLNGCLPRQECAGPSNHAIVDCDDRNAMYEVGWRKDRSDTLRSKLAGGRLPGSFDLIRRHFDLGLPVGPGVWEPVSDLVSWPSAALYPTFLFSSALSHAQRDKSIGSLLPLGTLVAAWDHDEVTPGKVVGNR